MSGIIVSHGNKFRVGTVLMHGFVIPNPDEKDLNLFIYRFKGNSELLEHTLARLETAGNWLNAKQILDFNKWDMESEIVQELYEIVETRFK